jgi:hypothetical protein
MKKVFALLMLVVLLSMTAMPALASRSWCATDPIVHLPDGQTLYIDVSVLEQYADREITLYILVPHGSTVEDVDGPINIHSVAVPVFSPERHIVAAIAQTQGTYQVVLAGKIDGDPLQTLQFPADNLPKTSKWLLKYPYGAWHW